MTKFTTQLFCLATLALGIAHAAPSYEVTLSDNVSVGGTKLKAGDYTVEMQGDKAVFKIGKKTVEIHATAEKSDQPFSATVVVMQYSQLKEIDLGGTQDKILFSAAK
jgi:hypothetical protein